MFFELAKVQIISFKFRKFDSSRVFAAERWRFRQLLSSLGGMVRTVE